MRMQRYIYRRLLQMIPVILFVMVLNFVIIHSAPGDPAVVMAGDHAPLEYIEELRKSYGLDQSLVTRLTTYFGKLLVGDLGYSFAYKRPVMDLLVERSLTTLMLVVSSQVLAILVGTLLGAVAARLKGRLPDLLISYSSLILYSLPVFWMGLLLILVFAVKLRWLPSSGMISFRASNIPRWLDIARHLILPATSLFLYTLPIYVRLTRSSVIEVAGEDFITTARAIGFTEKTVYMRHALRNALLPTVTVAGMSLSSLFTGALLTETVFAWPGMGRLVFEAVAQRDFPVLMGGFLFTTILVVFGSFITDIVYTTLDPRVVYS